MVSTENHKFVTGDRVAVAWGASTIDATIESDNGRHVLLRIDVPGPHGEVVDSHTISVPRQAIEGVYA
jgi:hypothetical protein